MHRGISFREVLPIVSILLMSAPATVRAEIFIEAYGGVANPFGGSFSAKETRYIGEPPEVHLSVDGDLNGSQGATFGIRCGYWFKNLNWLGGALDLNHFKVDSQDTDAELSFTSISPMLLFRYPLMIDDDFPNGRFYPYVGIGASLVVVDLSSTGINTSAQSDDSEFNNYGAFFCTGATWLFNRNVGFFAEYRAVSISFDENKDWNSGGSFGPVHRNSYEADGDVQTHQFLGGVSFHF
jgi:opacity protein-like surface antigen